MIIHKKSSFENEMKKSLLYFDLAELSEMIGDFLMYDIKSSNSNSSELPINPTRFHSAHFPSIPLGCYLKRITKAIPGLDSLILLLIVVYYMKLKVENRQFNFDSLMMHRFIAAVICVSSKFTSDFFYSNSYYAKVCGISPVEMNVLEVEFLLLMKWQVGYTAEELQEAIHALKSIDCNV